MFPSSYSSYSSSSCCPYPCYPSSSSSSSFPPFTFLNPENNAPPSNNSTFLIHDPLPVISVPYSSNNIPSHQHAPHNIPETLTNLAVADHCAAAMFKQEVMSNGGAYHHYGISNLLTKKPAAKKDRHSKIHTSQGLRDRRVRLSIEIARKFFDLQDMLGFDKASNTLEWLLTKSKRAIKELARSKNSSSAANSFSYSSEGEVDSVINQVIDGNLDLQQQGVVDSEERRLRRAQKEESRAKMKESREKARARARERTSNKIMCNNNNNSEKVQDFKKKCPALMEDDHPQILHQLRPPIQPHHHEESAMRSSPKLVQPHSHVVGSEAPRDDFNVIEESIVIKRKLKQSLMSSSSHHQNHVIPKESSFNNSDYHSSYHNLSPNWEANNNGATGSRSNFRTIASMNLSTRLQIFGKSWEECTNPRL